MEGRRNTPFRGGEAVGGGVMKENYKKISISQRSCVNRGIILAPFCAAS